jgi:hypothetical protein
VGDNKEKKFWEGGDLRKIANHRKNNEPYKSSFVAFLNLIEGETK